MLQPKPNIIVTDPPYGFNTIENAQELLPIYKRAIEVAMEKLEDDGHLVICLPQKSYVGKPLPFFTMPALVTIEVLTTAERFKRSVYNVAKSLPTPRNFFSPPYYWRSTIALKRLILHFRVGPRKV